MPNPNTRCQDIALTVAVDRQHEQTPTRVCAPQGGDLQVSRVVSTSSRRTSFGRDDHLMIFLLERLKAHTTGRAGRPTPRSSHMPHSLCHTSCNHNLQRLVRSRVACYR